MTMPPDEGLSDEGVPDEGWALLAQAGDPRAFDRLVGRYKEPLYRFIRRYVGNQTDAQDVLQESFIAAWVGLARYDAARPFAPWLRTIALNKCRDWGRRQAVRRLFLGRWAVEIAVMTDDCADSPDSESTPTEEMLRRLDQAIARLPASLKEPLLLTTTLGMSHEEAAAILEITAKSVEMRLYRARGRLREWTA